MARTVQEILEEAASRGGERFVTEAGINLTAGGRAVPAHAPAGRWILCGAGGSIPLPLAKELGLLDTPQEIDADADMPKQKAVHKAGVSDKAVRHDTDKAKDKFDFKEGAIIKRKPEPDKAGEPTEKSE